MAVDRHFFTITPLDAKSIAEAAGAGLHGVADLTARDAASLAEAGEGVLCFMNEAPSEAVLSRLSGAVVITTEALVTLLPVEFSFVRFRAFWFGCDLLEISLIALL